MIASRLRTRDVWVGLLAFFLSPIQFRTNPNAQAQMDQLQAVLSDLLSLRASSSQLNSALDRLRGVLTSIALETGFRDGSTITKAGFLQLQESFLHNGRLNI